jgi:hypothetical protein
MRRFLDAFLLFSAGAAGAGLHALGGLMLTPFFGPSPFFWANVLASLPLSIGLGAALGRAAERWRAVYGTAAAAGALVVAVPVALAPLARAVLDRDPDSLLAPAAAVLALLTLPSALAAVGAGGAARPHSPKGRGGMVLILAAGGVAGVAASGPSLLDPARLPPWIPLWMLAALLLLAGALGAGGAARVLAPFFALCFGTAFFLFSNEIRGYEYEKALEQAWALRAGRYYLETAGHRVLDRTEVARRYEELRAEIAKGRARSVAAVLVVESLRRMGAVEITGEGLRALLDLHLPAAAKPAVMPLFERVESIRSDGRGTIAFSLRWDREREGAREPIEVEIPDNKGGTTTFAFEADFTLTLRVDERPGETRTGIAIGPVEIERAGFFESHDTYKTPVLARNVRPFIDAHILGFSVIERRDAVEVHVQAQGPIGGIEDSVLQVYRLDE